MDIEIYHMDGPALTRLAAEVGLAPPAAWCEGDRFVMSCPYWQSLRISWCPAEDLVQAEAVFRQLRAHGFETMAQSRTTQGVCMAWCLGAPEPIILREWTTDMPLAHQERSEAMAMLRVSVLALAG